MSCGGETKNRKKEEGLGWLRKWPKRVGGKRMSFSISNHFTNCKLF
jgi:hypothetical protein